MYSSELSLSCFLGKRLKILWKSQENSGNLVSQKCGHPVMISLNLSFCQVQNTVTYQLKFDLSLRVQSCSFVFNVEPVELIIYYLSRSRNEVNEASVGYNYHKLLCYN